jgi:hypothetical protein
MTVLRGQTAESVECTEKERRSLSNSHDYIRPANEAERTYLESLIREDYERCYPDDTLEDMKRRSAFSKEDKGRLRDWMAIAALRAAETAAPFGVAAE